MVVGAANEYSFSDNLVPAGKEFHWKRTELFDRYDKVGMNYARDNGWSIVDSCKYPKLDDALRHLMKYGHFVYKNYVLFERLKPEPRIDKRINRETSNQGEINVRD